MPSNSAHSATMGAIADLVSAPGFQASLTTLPADTTIEEHVHDLPYLSLHVLGSYEENGNDGVTRIDGPAAAFHPAGSSHADRIGGLGLTTVVVTFEPDWLDDVLGRGWAPRRSTYWLCGQRAAAAAHLARKLLGKPSVPAVAAAVADFLRVKAEPFRAPREPPWLDRLRILVDEGRDPSAAGLARALGVTPAWLTRAYRAYGGEGLSGMLRRRRVERSILLLGRTDLSLADIAYDAGFSDQSHMNRVFKAYLRRTPVEVRAERCVHSAWSDSSPTR